MKILSRFGLCCISVATLCVAAPPKPKLVVGIVVDQFRYDYLTRFRSEYHGGFEMLLTRGANFSNAFYAQIPTVTAVGHSLFMSGAMPAVSGIVGNAWYDREAGQIVTSVCDWSVHTVGADDPKKGANCTDADPASPRRLLVSTLGDELMDAEPGATAIGVSLKERAAILPAGHRAKGAFWFNDVTGNFVTSSFYVQQLPDWVQQFNSQHLPETYAHQKWAAFPAMTFESPTGAKYGKLAASPFGNWLVEQLAEEAITANKLGQHTGVTDLLTVSFSSNDYIGHRFGPNSPEVKAMAVMTDEALGELFRTIDQTVGLANTIIVLTADHGVAATPAHDEQFKLPGGYIHANAEAIVDSALTARFGAGHWVLRGAGESSIYIDWKSVDQAHVSHANVYTTAREALLADASLHVVRVYTREQLENGIAGDFIATAAANGFFPRRSGDLSLIFEPNYMPGSSGVSHFSPYAYDRHVPVIFMGPGIKPGRYDETIQVNDIAPTLATMLDVQTPSGSSGRVLSEMLAH